MKKKLSKFKSFSLAVLKHPNQFLVFLKSMRNEEVVENDAHIILAADWLLQAQKFGEDDGYSRGYYLQKDGWDKSYIETTGYIIPTLLNVYEKIGDKRYLDSAKKAGKWLLDIQNDNGSFSDIDNGIELVFDTGQVLYGLIALYEEPTLSISEKERYYEAINNASSWLCSVQDKDGSWSRYGYQNMAHTYYSRVSSILYKAGLICENKIYQDAASKHIAWVLQNQKENGFFARLEFVEGEKPLLHAMIYVLEGLYAYYHLTKDENILKALLKNADKLKEINSTRDLLLCSQYDASFTCVNPQRCMTGLAQWANLAFKLYKITKDEDYLVCAKKSLYYLKSKQFKEGENLKGSLPGSVPFWGVYAPFSAVNWGVKFFIDAMVSYSEYEEDLITQSNEWIGECFRFHTHVITDEFSNTGEQYIKYLIPYVEQAGTILDLGCGEGKYIRYFQKLFPSKLFFGVDPVFHNGNDVKQGDVYAFEYPDKVDLIYAIEVMQHVKYLDKALENIHTHLKNNGYFVICDRDPHSFMGLLKPFYEYNGKWMYPFDSPFREKWYTFDNWQNILSKNGFVVEKIIPVKSSVGRINGMNKFNIFICKKQ